ncbi:unnamed protein product [Camellia sinensis]
MSSLAVNCDLRNECLLDGVQPKLGELQESIIIKLAIWLKASFKDFHYSINDVMFNISQIRKCIGEKV